MFYLLSFLSGEDRQKYITANGLNTLCSVSANMTMLSQQPRQSIWNYFRHLCDALRAENHLQKKSGGFYLLVLSVYQVDGISAEMSCLIP